MAQNGNRLADLLEERDWHRSRVAGVLNIGERTVYRWEVGEQDIPTKHLAALTELFGVTADYLLGLDREPTERAAA